MRRRRGILWLFTCLAVLTGCSSTYHPIAVTDTGLPAAADSGQPRIAVGTKVRITTIFGETTTGEVSRVTAEGLVLGKPGNYGLDERAFAYADMDRLEVVEDPESGEIMALVVFGVVVLLIGLFALNGVEVSFE